MIVDKTWTKPGFKSSDSIGNQKQLKTDHMALSIIIPSKGPKGLKVTPFTMEASN